MRCSYFEIYNDYIYDLLTDREHLTETLTIGESKHNEFYVKSLTEHDIKSIEEALAKLMWGERNRHYAITAMNHNSSRSHTIFRLTIYSIQRKDSFVNSGGANATFNSNNLNPQNKQHRQSCPSDLDSDYMEFSNTENDELESEFDSNSVLTEAMLVISNFISNNRILWISPDLRRSVITTTY